MMALELKQILKRGIRKLLASQGYALMKIPKVDTMGGALHAIAQRKHVFKTVIDVGASDGSWTAALMPYAPSSQYLLIEAQSFHAENLRQFCNEHENVQVVLAAAGETRGQIYFNATDPFSGQASYLTDELHKTQVPVTTIDDEIQSRKLAGPYLIKLDTHGFEVPILKGAARTLAETAVIVMECYNFRIAPECLLFNEMCDYLKRYDFRCIDLVDSLHRPCDGSLWQMDLVFVRDDRPEFSSAVYG